MGHAHGQEVHLVTQARRSLSEDISYRQHRYLLMMGIRVLCFMIAIIFFIAHLRWLILVPAIGAVLIPYIAVVFANGGREPDNMRGFLEHRVNLPARREPPDGAARLSKHGKHSAIYGTCFNSAKVPFTSLNAGHGRPRTGR